MKKGYLCCLLLLFIAIFTSCKDDYLLDNESPSWLGSSIYDYLYENGNYNYFVKLIEDCGRKDELQRTGSNTLFVADDEAFSRFLASNDWGVKNYDDLTSLQKNLLLRNSLLKNASLMETLSSGLNSAKGQVIRLGNYLDLAPAVLVQKVSGDSLPATSAFSRFRSKGMYLLKDDTAPMLALFSPAWLEYNSVTNHDFYVIMNQTARTDNDNYIFNIKVKENTASTINHDITCKNGYIHVLENLLTSRLNMAEYIRRNPNMSIFNRILQRFSAPKHSAEMTTAYKQFNTSFSDSVFVQRFYSQRHKSTSGNGVVSSTDVGAGSSEPLIYDPGWNQYYSSTTDVTKDLGAMFVPSDDAMNNYFYNGDGKFLYERYGSWDNVPLSVVSVFLNAHMKSSMIGSVPSRFNGIKNESGNEMNVSENQIEKAYVASNGLVYQTNMVYPPVDYSSVLAPTLVSDNTKIWRWAVNNCNFKLYLNSMESTYSFLIPTDSYLNDYRDPVKQNYAIKEVWKFWYNNTLNDGQGQPVATRYNASTGDSIGYEQNVAIIKDRLEDMMDYHIVVGDIESGQSYYLTKGGGFIKVSGTGASLKLWGGGNIELNASKSTNSYTASVTDIYNMKNGKVYVLDKQLQHPIKSLYQELRNTPQFSKFFALCEGSDSIFVKDATYPGYDYNVKFFSAYHYTVYVPTNDAIDAAIAAGLPTWEEINSEGDATVKATKRKKLENFLKYHFQDNSIYIGGAHNANQAYSTAASYTVSGTSKIKFYNLKVTNDDTSLKLLDGAGRTVHVYKNNSLYNLMLRDYGFQCVKGDLSTATQIDFSSRIVVHEIDNYLLYSKEELSQ